MYVEKWSPFSLFALYASDNLVRILLQLGTFHAHYTSTRTKNTYFCWCYMKYTRQLLSILLQASVKFERLMIWLHRWIYTFWIEPICLRNFNTTKEIKISKLSLKNEVARPGNWVCFFLSPEDGNWSPWRPGTARAQPWNPNWLEADQLAIYKTGWELRRWTWDYWEHHGSS